jgi:DinB superfamily
MNTEEICLLLKQNESALIDLYKISGQVFWHTQPQGKWKASQHLVHLVQSTAPLVKALGYPSFVLKWKFGTSNRPSRIYDEVISRYHQKLSQAGDVVSPFSKNMPDPEYQDAPQWFAEFTTLNDKLIKKSKKLDETKLDKLLLPHPLMGKMTLREILMWNAYHTEHHLAILKQKYSNSNS